jgi:hypothetical protein
MRYHFSMVLVLSAAIGAATTGIARADCESDLIQLEQAFNAPNLTTAGRAALDEAKTTAVSALKKDEDATCHKAIADGMTKAGMVLK